ncbi:MAG: CRISPR-associated protein (cas_TM1802) [Pelotomaculum sp. PtaB.Bin013]|uniref:TM1802 family CRISPR-associated protein n=1 Tax=Pelotomaculum isophthalicicum JI TaxID=947010 RepID=A0A9X4JSP9_9FIRM|nr:TM1802 family CRISPR-associated protein [Pelotomaculum isophthalicicum]MDF9407074.1 TM1802 family CRISPR-associated protein [Pelotomaculum isophthalicicum JI]OPX81505.1 MAG: CRISPR-associated protein (cas_TM1802) [Pelotomaculum sp. PtaB.Bin013]
MNLPQLTAYIGDSAGDNQNVFSSIIQQVRGVQSDGENYVIALVFDLKTEEIYFKLQAQFSSNSAKEYNYFGNNKAASSQYYLSRETGSLYYLLGSIWNDLYLMLKRYDMENSDLASLIVKMKDSKLVSLSPQIGNGKVNFDKFSLFKDKGLTLSLDKKKIKIKDREYSFDAFVRMFLNDDNKNNKYVLVVPAVRFENNEEEILSVHPDYLELVRRANKLDNNIKARKGIERVCYICGEKKADVLSEYTTKFERTGINKMFTTTTINTSPFFNKSNYDDVYSMCTGCYQKLLAGEKIISRQYRSKIAGENVFIIPEGLLGFFDYNHAYKLKGSVDLAFKSNSAEEWLRDIEAAALFDDINLYSLNFIFYRTDGNSVTVLEVIEDIPTIRFQKVIKTLGDNAAILNNHLKGMSLGQIYRAVPVRTNKSGEQLDIGRVLSLYKTILSGGQINTEVLFGYADEALDKGLRQINKQKIDNYHNMGLQYYLGYEDFFIKRIVMSYLVLFRTCQQLCILNQPVCFFKGKGEKELDTIDTASKKVNLSIEDMERFLENQGFSIEAKALYFLGVLINRVAIAQLQKEHKTKPILKKIQFQGMKDKDVHRLYEEVIEKLRQYGKFTLFAEAVMNRFHYYYGTLDRTWPLSERANVFYIMSGYAYMVGKKAPDITAEEEEILESSIEESKL